MKKYNWKKAAAWICTLTLLTGTLSLSSFGEIGPGAALSETIAGTVAAAAEAVGTAVGTVADTVGDVFMRGPGTASASDAKKAPGNDASPSVATDPDASQFDADGILIDGIALIDDVSTPADALPAPMMMRGLLGAPAPRLAEFFEAMDTACQGWTGEEMIMVSGLEEFNVTAKTVSDMDELYKLFINAYPEHFFLDHSSPDFAADSETNVIRSVYLPVHRDYITDSHTTDYADYLRDYAGEVLDGIPTGADRMLTALYLHDWLCNHVTYVTGKDGEYDSDNSDFYNAYGAILNGSAACQGYAHAYSYLLKQAGVPSYVVWANNHTWNVVNIGTDETPNWLYTDCTQDDPTGMYEYYFGSVTFSV